MNASTGRLLRLCRKELRETLRDRRTLLTLVLMPLLLYPLLSMTLQRFLLSAQSGDGTVLYRVAVDTPQQGHLFRSLLDDPASQPPPEILQASDSQLASFQFFVRERLSPEEMLRWKLVDLAAEIHPGEPPTITLTADSSHAASLAARRILIERIQWLRLARAQAELAVLAPEMARQQAQVVLRTIGTEAGGSALATLVPLILVLMTITGAVYPAIDLTAGERERGTIEALIASPVPRSHVLFAKYVAVVSVALLTAIVNLVAMLVTLKAGGLMRLLTGDSDAIPWFSLLQIFGLLVLFSGFFAALLLCLTSFAKSFKEAQAYLIPLMLIALAPGILSLIPGVELTPALAVIPLVNITLLARELLSGVVNPVAALAAVVSTIVYAAAALGVAARLFGSDAILRGSERSAGSLLQRPAAARDVPTPAAAALTMAVIFPVYFLLSNLLAQAAEMPFASRLVASGVSLALVFGGIPLLMALLGRDRLRSTFRLQSPLPRRRQWLAVLGAGLMGLGLWALAHESFVLTSGELDPAKVEAAETMLRSLQQTPPWLFLLALAVTPGVIEELCFRGYQIGRAHV